MADKGSSAMSASLIADQQAGAKICNCDLAGDDQVREPERRGFYSGGAGLLKRAHHWHTKHSDESLLGKDCRK